MKKAATISEMAMKTAMETISPDVRQCDAVAEIQRTLFRGTPEYGGEYASIATLLPTGKGTSADVPFPVGSKVAILAYSPPYSGVPLNKVL